MYPDATFYSAQLFGVFVALHPKYSDLLADKVAYSDLCRSIVYAAYQQWHESVGQLLDHVERTTEAVMTELVNAAVSSTTPSPPPSTTSSPPPSTTPSPPSSTTPSPPPSTPPPSSILDRILSWLSNYSFCRDADSLLHKGLFYLTLLKSACSWSLHFFRVRSLTVRVCSQLCAFLADSSQEMTLRVPCSSRRRSRRHSTPNRSPAPRVGSRPYSPSPIAATAPLLQVGDGGFVHQLFPWRSIPGLPDGVAWWLLGGRMGVTQQQLMQSRLLQDQHNLEDVSVYPVWSTMDPGTITMTVLRRLRLRIGVE